MKPIPISIDIYRCPDILHAAMVMTLPETSSPEFAVAIAQLQLALDAQPGAETYYRNRASQWLNVFGSPDALEENIRELFDGWEITAIRHHEVTQTELLAAAELRS